MWKKNIAILGAATLAFLTASTTTVYAGGINAAEQRIIDFYNGTFTYNGKTYVATESAKSAAYNKLVADDVDLTDAQVTSAISQARSSIRQGIEEGHLVEAGSGGDDNGNGGSGDNGNSNSGENGTGNNGSGDNGNSNSGENGTGNNGSGDNGNNGSGDNGTGNGNNGSGENGTGSTGNNGSEENGTGNGNNGSGENGTGNGNNASGDNGSEGNGTGGSGNTPPEDNGSGNNNSGNNASNGGDNTGNNGVGNIGNGKTIDIDALFQELSKNKDHTTVYGLQGTSSLQNAKLSGNTFTAEQYLLGKSIAATQDGQLLLETDLPIKNTGFYNGGAKRLLMFAGIVFACLMLAVILLARSKKNRKGIRYIVTPLVFTLALTGFFGLLLTGALGNQLDKWKSLWIAGAPGYSYAYAAQGEDLPAEGAIAREGLSLPLSGDQYGELACEKAGLQAPLYYGDSEEVLKKGAGTYAGSYLPGMGGTILVGAHDATFFAPLEKMEKDDVISLTTTYGSYQYRVTKTQVADLMDASIYQISKDEEELVLYTCYPFGVEDEVREQRFYVYAEKISGPEIGE